jgi:hypothetical protein
MRKGFPRGTETWDEIPIHIPLKGQAPEKMDMKKPKSLTQNGVLVNEETIIRNTFVNAQLVTLEESQ